MTKFVKDNVNKIIAVIIVLLLLVFYLINMFSIKEYSSYFFYMDTDINIRLFTNNKNKAEKALKHVEQIYKEYHILTDKYKSYDDVINVNYINNNNSKEKYLKIDKKLYDLIKYGIKSYEITNGLININIGNVTDVWKKYRDNKNGVPNIEELKNAGSIDINEIVLTDDYKILNNKPNIDLGAIVKGYTTEVAGKYLENIGITKYIINAGGNVKVGKHYNGKKYRIGVQDPTDISKTIDVVEKNNVSVVMSGDYIRKYEYDGAVYGHIIDPNTLYPANYLRGVCVVTKDSALADVLSTALFLMDIEEGKDFIKNFDNVEVLWYTNDGNIIKTDGFN